MQFQSNGNNQSSDMLSLQIKGVFNSLRHQMQHILITEYSKYSQPIPQQTKQKNLKQTVSVHSNLGIDYSKVCSFEDFASVELEQTSLFETLNGHEMKLNSSTDGSSHRNEHGSGFKMDSIESKVRMNEFADRNGHWASYSFKKQ